MEINLTLQNKSKKMAKKSPKNISFFMDIINDSYTYSVLDNIFTTVKSINNILLIIYTNKYNSIFSYNLIDNKIITEIKNAHDNYIINFRHYLDKNNKIDLLLSISNKDNNIKIWNIQNWNCLLNIKNISQEGFLFSATFLDDNNNIYFLTSNSNWDKDNRESIKVYDFNGNKIKEINDSLDNTFFIETYFDKSLSNNFIITGNEENVKSYDYNNNKLYYKYFENNSCNIHYSIIVNYNNNILKLIDSCDDGYIRIWNFHMGILLNKIKADSNGLMGICLWADNYLFVGCKENIKLIELENKNIIKTFKKYENWVLTLKKINHPQYGDCLISKDYFNSNIELWIIKD